MKRHLIALLLLLALFAGVKLLALVAYRWSSL